MVAENFGEGDGEETPSLFPSTSTLAAEAPLAEAAPSPQNPSVASSPFSSVKSDASLKKNSPNEGISSKPRRRTRMVIINPPSAFHPDIHPPSLVRVQRALCAHSREGPLRQLHQQPHVRTLPASPFQDAKGRFTLQGSAGGFYAGDLLGGLPHGFGQHHIPHPASGKMHLLYDGEWSHGSKTGFGSVFYTNGEDYRGELRNNQRWGRGWMKYKDGSFYCGDWLRGRRHGIGLHYLKNGNFYHGAFCKDSQDGWGIFYWPSANRRFEGEWVANQPYSGYYSAMEPGDLDFVGGMLLQYCPQSRFCPLLQSVSNNKQEMTKLHLQHPMLPIFSVISMLRSLKAGERDSKVLFKTQVGRKENLTASELQILKKLFEVMVPMIDNKGQLHVVHLRRMLLLALIDPDIGQGQKLLAHLQACTTGRTSVGFDDLLLYTLQFHRP